MKRLIIIMSILGLLIAACAREPKDVAISGVIANSPVDQVEVFYIKDFITNERQSAVFDLDESGFFAGSIDLAEGQFANIRIGRMEFPLYLLPGADIKLTFDADFPDVLPVLEGKKVLESLFLLSFHNEVMPQNSRSFFLNQVTEKTPEEFVIAIENSLSEKSAFLSDHLNFSKFNEGFVSKLQSIFTFEKYELLMLYPRIWASANPGEELVLPENYFEFLNREDIFNDAAANSRPYFAFASEYLAKFVIDTEGLIEDQQVSFEMNLKHANELFTLRTREAMLGKAMLDLVRYGNYERAHELYPLFKEKVASGFYYDFVASEFEKIGATAPGQPAPDFTLEDINGNLVSMSDFKGKVVYLDFWATWCGPCMRQMPYMKELKGRMEGKDVVFLYISVDEDPEAWRKTVAEREIGGIHLNVPGRQHPVPVSYAVRGIPKFMLIGRDGTIIDNVPPRPNNPAIDQAILSALEL